MAESAQTSNVKRQREGDVLQAVSEFLQALQRSDVHLQAVYLYGSHATGKARPDSDIDIALISDDFGDWLKDHQRMVRALLACDTRIEPVRFRPEEFCDENPLAWEIKTKGIRLL
jgi:predicted nucleotidyltransferase